MIVVYTKHCRVGGKLTLDDLEVTEKVIGRCPEFRSACGCAASQGWLVVANDTVTPTTAGMAAV
jgi:hypothetical protein